MFLALLLFVASMMVGALLRPKPQYNQPAPNSLGDFDLPTAQVGRAIPVICGTCKISGGNTVWWGDLTVEPVIATQSSFFGLINSSQLVNYMYSLSVQYALAWGPCDLVALRCNNKPIPNDAAVPGYARPEYGTACSYWTTPTPNGDGSENCTTINIDAQALFGGQYEGGGLFGQFRYYRGVPTQSPDGYLDSGQGRQAPSYKNLCHAVFEKFYFGTSDHVNPVEFIVSRCPDPLNQGPSVAKIGGAVCLLPSAYYPNRQKPSKISGNGELTDLTLGSSPVAESYVVCCTGTGGVASAGPSSGPGAGAGQYTVVGSAVFSVTGSVSGGLGNATVGTPFTSPQLNFNITQGTQNFLTGDMFLIVTYQNWDGNPALLIYELLTSQVRSNGQNYKFPFGLGIDPSHIDQAAFAAAAETLAEEGLGISMQIDSPSQAQQIIDDICRHIDAVVYEDLFTGLLTIKLARADYDPATLPVIGPNDVEGIPDYARGSWDETINFLTLVYTDASLNFQPWPASAQDSANIAASGGVRFDVQDYKGITNFQTASLVCSRTLKTLSYPLSKLRVMLNRRLWSLRPGDCFKFDWAPLGIAEDIFRIVRINYGSLTDSKMQIEAVEDIWGLEYDVFEAITPNPWKTPGAYPVAFVCNPPVFIEPPDSLVLATASTAGYWLWMAVSGPNLIAWHGCMVQVSVDGVNFRNVGSVSLQAKMGMLVGALASFSGTNPDSTDSLAVDLGESQGYLGSFTTGDAAGGRSLCAIIDSNGNFELLSYTTAAQTGTNQFTLTGLYRGLYGTPIAAHASGATFVVLDDAVFHLPVDAAWIGQTLYVKLGTGTTVYTYAFKGGYNNFAQIVQNNGQLQLVADSGSPTGYGLYVEHIQGSLGLGVTFTKSDGTTFLVPRAYFSDIQPSTEYWALYNPGSQQLYLLTDPNQAAAMAYHGHVVIGSTTTGGGGGGGFGGFSARIQ